MALRIDPDGTQTEVTLAGNETDLKTLQDIVGGYIEVVPMPRVRVVSREHGTHVYDAIVVNEDGRMQNLLFNAVATMVWLRAYEQHDVALREDQILVGTVVLAERKELY